MSKIKPAQHSTSTNLEYIWIKTPAYCPSYKTESLKSVQLHGTLNFSFTPSLLKNRRNVMPTSGKKYASDFDLLSKKCKKWLTQCIK